MKKSKSVFSDLSHAYGVVVAAIRKDPRIFTPFLIFAGIELLSLVFIYLIPRMPLRTVMGPIITTFWGEEFLHYPKNFLLLPKLAGYARMNLTVIFGALLTGMAVAYLYKLPFATAFRKYTNLLCLVFILTFSYFIFYKGMGWLLLKYFRAGHEKLLFVGPRLWLGPIQVVYNQLLALVLQALFAYAIPVLMSTDKKFIGAIGGSVRFFIRHAGVTLLLVGLPMLFAVPLIFLNSNGSFLMVKFVPEIIFWLGILGIGINSLLIDPMITLTTAVFYAENKEKK